METLIAIFHDYSYWIIHCAGLYIIWDISNNDKLNDTLLNTPVTYFLIGVITTQIATWFNKLPRG